MREAARPRLLCTLAISAALVAPACLAQDAAAPERAATDAATVQTLDQADPGEATQPRSAFGRVMSIMITALKQESAAPDRKAPPPQRAQARTAQGAPPAKPVHSIQVGAAFRLDQPTVAAESATARGPGAD
jgi:hypothetical protein